MHFRNQVNKGFGVAFAASNLSFTFQAVEDKEGCFGDESYAEVIWSRSHIRSKAIWGGQDAGAVAVDTARIVSGCHAGDVDARWVNFRETVQERLSP